MTVLSVRAPAKINLVLRVCGRNAAGYHELQMVMVKLALADELHLESIPRGIVFSSEGVSDEGMNPNDNLVVRAARAMLVHSKQERGVRLHLKKCLPIAAGLGGGSSDAAAVLRGLNTLWDLHVSPTALAEIGVTLGADVPFFCYDGPAFVEGIGERVTFIPSFPKLFLLLVNPDVAVSTKWVFEEFDRRRNQGEIHLTGERSGASFRRFFRSFRDVTDALQNDLEAVTISAYPEVAAIKRCLLQAGASGALMSGSGPTVFGVFHDAALRDAAQQAVRQSGWRVFVTETETWGVDKR